MTRACPAPAGGRDGKRAGREQAGQQILEEREDRAALEVAADDHLTCRIDAMDLKDRFREVEPDGHDRFHLHLPDA
jgi:hypothetical protein